jgi:hypothetical protein
MLSTPQPEPLQDLRHTYAFTHSQFLASKHEYESFHQRLQTFPVPSSAWSPSLTRHHATLKKTCHFDLKAFFTAAQNLQLAQSRSKPEPAPEPPPPPAKREHRGIYHQTVFVSVVDGKTHTRFSPGPAHWVNIDAWHLAKTFRRQYVLESGYAPPEYSFVLEHNGDLYPPSRNIFTSFLTEDFIQLCHREIESRSPHALDGTRLNYWHYDDNIQPIGRVPPKEPDIPDNS